MVAGALPWLLVDVLLSRLSQHSSFPGLCMLSEAEIMSENTANLWRSSQRRSSSASLLRPDTTKAVLLLTLLGHAAQVRLGSSLLAAGARIASKLDQGEWHRLVTSLFLHADGSHLIKNVVMGVLRLVAPAAAIFGGVQTILILILSGVGGNFLSHLLRSSGDAPSVGVSAGMLGLDAALFAYGLRNAPRSAYGLRLAMRRGALTLILASLRSGGGGGGLQIDHAAHMGGYGVGLIAGYLLAPSVRHSADAFRRRVLEEMSDRVSESCGPTSVTAERAMQSYLRRFPPTARAAVLSNWTLQQVGSASAGVARTEDWPQVFESLKEFVAKDLRIKLAVTKAAGESNPNGAARRGGGREGEESAASHEDIDASISDKEQARRQKLRAAAEVMVWKHFEHRAVVALPSLRLLRYGETGLVTLQQMRRWRVSVGSLVPPWVGESLGGLALVYLGVAFEQAYRQSRGAT